MALTNRIDKTIRFKVWEKYYDGESVKAIAKACNTSVEHVNGIVVDFRRAERDAKRKFNERIILEDKNNVSYYLDKNRFKAVDFVFYSKNKEFLKAYKKLEHILNPAI